MRRSGIASFVLWICLTILTLLPVWWMLVVSMRPRVKLYSKSVLIDDLYWNNFLAVLNSSTFLQYLWNSLIVATSNAALVCALGLLAAFGLSRYKIGGGDNVFFWLITNRMAPPAVFLLPLFLLFTEVVRVRRFHAVRHEDWPNPALLRLQPALRHLALEGNARRDSAGA
ncbi:hypothetical protein MHI61_08580 [Rhizobium sp. K102]|nr:hypothetical protein [Rhizobium sp. K102]ULR45253.1 hypothetical protein MHI61_08580 [Rhizobium sp. K102]